MNDQKNDKTEAEIPSLYMHIYEEGEVFLVTDDGTTWVNADATRVKAEISIIVERKGFIQYSVDENEESNQTVEQILELLSDAETYVNFLKYPHPAVYGYTKSYAPYIYDALEVATVDVEALSSDLEEIKKLHKELKEGTTQHRENLELITELQEKLDYAQYALKKIEELELDICSETEGGEH